LSKDFLEETRIDEQIEFRLLFTNKHSSTPLSVMINGS